MSIDWAGRVRRSGVFLDGPADHLLALLQAVLDAVPEAFLAVVDHDRQVLLARGALLPGAGDPEPAVLAELVAALEPALAAGLDGRIEEGLVEWDGGRVVDARVGPVHDDAGAVIACVVIAHDVTERRAVHESLAEQHRALQDSQERYRLLAENSSDLILRLDAEGNCLYASPASRLLLGLDPREIKSGRIFEELVHPDDAARLSALREAIVERGKTASVTARFRHASGEYRSLDLQAKAVLNTVPALESVNVTQAAPPTFELLITVRDATDRVAAAKRLRQRETDLAHADRMSTMGQMAAELAHELNQPLYAIANFATVSADALTQAGKDPATAIAKAQHWLEEISRQSRRAADVIRRVNLFVRKGEMDPSTFDISECVRTLEPLLDVAARAHDATIRYELVEPLPVLADRLLIEQVIVNLVRNAAEAMEESPAAERHILVRTYPAAGPAPAALAGVGLSVTDTGPGLRPEVVERLFEPYYTTKESGTGMGLPICRSTLEAHQGKILAEDSPVANADGTHGAHFHIWLPIAES